MKYALCSLQGFMDVFNKKSAQTQNSGLSQAPAPPEGICREFSLAEIKAATNNFHQDLKIGDGGFGPVYRGSLDDGAIIVAVKLLGLSSGQGREEFRTEVKLLCQLHHPHLVSLIGFCQEQNTMILVYEYMSRGSLDSHLYGKDCVPPLSWNHRLQICIGAARGLHYLHTGAKRAVIHRDIKCSSILLDDKWSSKLSDFGLSKLGPPSMSKASIKRMESRIAGTIIYAAPEYAMHGELTEKADVYSFGVTLFVVLCGRSAADLTLTSERRNIDVFEWVRNLTREGTMYHVIDPYLKGRIAPECFKKYWEIARSCVHRKGNKRPAMGEVEVTLELALELQKKADSEMEGNAPHDEWMYEEASFPTDSYERMHETASFSIDSDSDIDRYGNSNRGEPDGSNLDYSSGGGGYLSDSDIEATLYR